MVIPNTFATLMGQACKPRRAWPEAGIYCVANLDKDWLLVQSIAGALFQVMKSWAESGMSVPIKKVRVIIEDFLNPAVIEKLRLCESQ